MTGSPIRTWFVVALILSGRATAPSSLDSRGAARYERRFCLAGALGDHDAFRNSTRQPGRGRAVVGWGVDRRRRTPAGGGRGFAPLLGQRRETRDPRSRRSSAHGHCRRVVHRSRSGRTRGRAGRRSPIAASGPSTISCSRKPATIRPRRPRAFPGRTRVALLSAVGETVYEFGRRFLRHRRLSRRSRRDVLAPRPAAVALALDSDGVSPRDVWAAQRADHHADQLSGRRDRHSAGHLPARQLRRRGLRRQSGWRLGFARTRRAR